MAIPVFSKTVAEVRYCAVDFSSKLRPGELLTGSPTIASLPTGLTITNATISGIDIVINGRTVPAFKAIVWLVSAGAANVSYLISVMCATNFTLPETLQEYCPLDVVA